MWTAELALRGALALTLAAAGWTVFHQAAALATGREDPDREGLERALGWDSSNPHTHYRLGLILRDGVGDQDAEGAHRYLERATRLNPYNWQYWVDLALLLEREGDLAGAEGALQRDLALHPRRAAEHWRLANFYLRHDRLDEAATHLREAITRDPRLMPAALGLLDSAGAAEDEIARLWPRDGPARLALLRGLTDEIRARPPSLELVARLWEQVMRDPLRPSRADGQFLVEHLVDRGALGMARRCWIDLARVDGLVDRDFETGANLLWDGGFERRPGPGAFGWRLPGDLRAAVSHHPEGGESGSGALRLDLAAMPTDRRALLHQLVLAPPLARARLTVVYRRSGGGGDLRLQLVGADAPVLASPGEPLAPTASWTRVVGSFEPPAEPGALRLVLRSLADEEMSGELWLDSVVLAHEYAGHAPVSQ